MSELLLLSSGPIPIGREVSKSAAARLKETYEAKSRVHWDWTVMQPTDLLDGRILIKNGRIF
jgi:hypothetical protein